MALEMAHRLGGPTRRLALATAAILLLFAVAVGVTVWRYDDAGAAYRAALDRRASAEVFRDAATDMWRESALTARGVLAGERAELAKAATARAAFAADLARATPDDPRELADLRQIRSLNAARLQMLDARVLPAAGTPAAVARYRAYTPSIDRLGALLQTAARGEDADAAAAAAVARGAEHDAVLAGLLTGGFGLVLGALLGAYAVILVRRLLGRIETTVAVLAPTLVSLRAAIRIQPPAPIPSYQPFIIVKPPLIVDCTLTVGGPDQGSTLHGIKIRSRSGAR